MIKVSFIGDVCFNGIFERKLKIGQAILSSEISNNLSNQEFVCCNFEGPETDEDYSGKKGTSLKNAKGSVGYLSMNGINVFNLANNHICDYGKKGLEETIETISGETSSFAGAGLYEEDALKPIILRKDDESVALLAYAEKEKPIAKRNNFGMAGIPSIKKIKEYINALKKEHKWVVIMYHGGEEFSRYPSPRKRKLLQKIAKKTKVDAIIAHHSHTFQGIEKINGKPIFYSLGNFVFDLENHDIFPFTNESAIVTLSFTENGVSYEILPTVCDTKEGEIRKTDFGFIKEIEDRSDFENFNNKWRKECFRLVFNRPVHKMLNPEGKSLQSKSPMLLLFSSKFYNRVFTILNNWKLRNQYFNALYYKYLSK
ncbi:MAG: CapA family protein [Salinivirgaceae bacterium]|jgi:poly-gamma-glutamate synthesis protein (capsule biosynthesis protein)|nr:CapA family protein [Salinivirgaceae bacterium]